jgi:GAF domain-containing protein
VEVGLTPFVQLNNRFVLDETCTKHGLMGRHWKANNADDMTAYRMCVEFLSEHPESIALSVLDEKVIGVFPLLQILINNGVKSYLFYPIQNNDGLLGLLELASHIPNQLNQEVMNPCYRWPC